MEKLKLLPVIFLLFMLITPVFAEWIENYIEGEWLICERTQWIT